VMAKEVALDEEADDGLEDEGEKEGEDQLGDAVLNEVGEVGLPGSFDVLEETLVVCNVGGEVWIGCKKRHRFGALGNWMQFNMQDTGLLWRWDAREAGYGVRFPDGAGRAVERGGYSGMRDCE